MSTLWKYPCGCVGLGEPGSPAIEDGVEVWRGVILVSDCREFEWTLPGIRQAVLSSSDGSKPSPMPEESESSYRKFLNNLAKNAQSWQALKSAVKDLTHE